MRLIAAVAVVNRRGRTEIRTIPIARLPSWRFVVDEALDALRPRRSELGERSRRLRRHLGTVSAPSRRRYNP